VGLGVVAIGAALAQAELKLDRIDEFVQSDRARTARWRADEAIDGWGAAWVDSWLRAQGLDGGAQPELLVCVERYLYALDEVSVQGNVVRFEPIEDARRGAERCVAAAIGVRQAGPFVKDLQQRWGRYLESRGEVAPQLPERRR